MPNCSSCGSPIPEGQGSSCSMCYGDIAYGRDGYYEERARSQDEREEWARAQDEREEERMFQEQEDRRKDEEKET